MAALASRSDPGGGCAERSYSWDESYLRRGGGGGNNRIDGHDPYSYHDHPDGPLSDAAAGLASTSSSSASPPEYLRQHPSYRAPASPVVLRTNFGKDSSYRPPPTAPSSSASPPRAFPRDRSGRSLASEDSAPFDQRGDDAIALRRRRSASAGSAASSSHGASRRRAAAGRASSSSLSAGAEVAAASSPHGGYRPRHRRQPSESSASASAGDRPFDESRGTIRADDPPRGRRAQPQPPHQPPTIRRVLGAERTRRSALEAGGGGGGGGGGGDLRTPEGERLGAAGGPHSSTIAPRFRGYQPATPSEPSGGEEEEGANAGAFDEGTGGEDDDDGSASHQRRYRMAPPRISDPVLLPYLAALSPVARGEQDDDGGGGGGGGATASSTPSSLSPRGGVGKSQSSAGKSRGGAGTGSSSKRHHQQQPSRRRAAGGGGREPPEDDDEDNDSIFDFEEENQLRNGGASSGRGGRGRKSRSSAGANPSAKGADARRPYPTAYVSTTEEDDEEDEFADPSHGSIGRGASSSPLTLTERAQAAWRRKEAQRSRSASPRGKPPSASRSTGQHEDAAPSASANGSAAVRFSQNDDTVHHFEPDQDPDETLDSITFGGRSLNSEYTKSAESEVEDFIKDILMIGDGKGNNPGRRKVKYSPKMKLKVQARNGKAAPAADDDVDPDEQEEEEEEDATFESNEDEDDDLCSPSEVVVEGRRKPSSASRSRRDRSRSAGKQQQHQPPREPSVFCVAGDDSVDGPGAPRGAAGERTGGGGGSDPLSSVWNYLEGGISAVTSALGFDDGSHMTPQRNRSAGRRSAAASSSQYSPGDATDSVTTEGLFDPAVDEGDVYAGGRGRDRGNLEAAPSLEEDARLVDLALQAARSMHKLRGFEYDETTEINIASDIRFSVVDLSLPLGLIFQENETGCWVTKVLPEGSAAKCKYVEVGDQLAAIDGVSAIRMTVGDIAALIRRKSSDIELTFLRYVGPWRPAEGTVAEEGYEVRMQTRREHPINLPGCGLGGSGGAATKGKRTVVSPAWSASPPAKPQSARNLRSAGSGAARPASRRPLTQSRSLSPGPRRGGAAKPASSSRPGRSNNNAAAAAAAQQPQGKGRLGFLRFGKKK